MHHPIVCRPSRHRPNTTTALTYPTSRGHTASLKPADLGSNTDAHLQLPESVYIPTILRRLCHSHTVSETGSQFMYLHCGRHGQLLWLGTSVTSTNSCCLLTKTNVPGRGYANAGGFRIGTDLCCLGQSLGQPQGWTLESPLVVSVQHSAAAHAQRPAGALSWSVKHPHGQQTLCHGRR